VGYKVNGGRPLKTILTCNEKFLLNVQEKDIKLRTQGVVRNMGKLKALCHSSLSLSLFYSGDLIPSFFEV